MKKEYIANFFLFLAVLFACLGLMVSMRNHRMQHHISNAVIRFHVIANSDSQVDQDVKYKVRDRILSDVQTIMAGAGSKKEAKELLEGQLETITAAADGVLKEEGMQYTAAAGMEYTAFPEKTYGDLTFPAGDYDAVRVVLGDGGGQNWWCVMFPTLCLVDGTCETVPKMSKKKLKKVLADDEYSLLTKQKEDMEIEYRVHMPKWLKKLLKKIS